MDASLHPPAQSHAQIVSELIQALPSFEHQCLSVLAALSVGVNRTTFAKTLRQLGVSPDHALGATTETHAIAPRNLKGQRGSSVGGVSAQQLQRMVEGWVRLGLVEAEDGEFSCRGWAAHATLSDARARLLLEHLRRAWEQQDYYHDDGLNRADYQLRPILHVLRRVRVALYLDLREEAEELFAVAKRLAGARRVDLSQLHALLIDPRGPAEPLLSLPEGLRSEYYRQVLPAALRELTNLSPALQQAALQQCEASEELWLHVHALAAVSGEPIHDGVLSGREGRFALELRALSALQRGQLVEARALAEAAFRAKYAKGSAYTRPSSPLSPLLTFLLATGEPPHAAAARSQLQRIARKGAVPNAYMASAVFLHENARPRGEQEVVWTPLLYALAAIFLDAGVSAQLQGLLTANAKTYRKLGVHWFAAQCERVLEALQAPERRAALTSDTTCLLALHKIVPAWQRGLMALESLVVGPAAEASTQAEATRLSEQRLVFELQLSQGSAPWVAPGAPGASDAAQPNWVQITPRLQVRRGEGYTAGRPVALRTLVEQGSELDYLSDEDRAVIEHIEAHRDWNGTHFSFGPRALVALVGHPRVFWADKLDRAPVDIVHRRPTLHAVRGANGHMLHVSPAVNHHGLGIARDGEDQLGVCAYSPVQLRVAESIAAVPLVPAEGAEQLRKTLARLAGLFTVESDVGLDAAAQALETVVADCRPVVELQRAEPGLRARVCVAPLGAAGPRYRPGVGASSVAAVLRDAHVGCQRDLAREQQALDRLLAVAPALAAAIGGSRLSVDNLTDCLALLSALAGLGDDVVVEWPDADPIQLSTATMASLSLDLEERHGWFEASGTLRLDEARVLDLMSALERRTQDGAYLKLDTDRYLALSDELQAQLRALEAAATTAPPSEHAGHLRMAPIALGFVSPWLKSLRVHGALQVDTRVAEQLARIERAYAAEPQPPRTFEAQLRSYQQLGFTFLARLASFGAGACLADDMGLGKTLMSLALLSERAALGPALVVAPTSVRANWFDEAQRFAPSLRMCAWDAPDAACPALEAFDVLVCTYTVMAQRIEQLERLQFATVVLDEAQAIKNGATQRAIAARRLVSQARVALTGTPVENHLGDLHGIMSFLNPGLLGDAKHFEARFAKPIQREHDAHAHEQLKTLIAPFLLRRKKSEVLKDLPARTEITLRVEPEPDEQAFTEALRRSALLRLSGASGTRSAISILAEITRLRRAACHPRLVDADTCLGAAKLERLVELAHELRDGGHRALVFSQFVDFLHIVRERLTAEGFSYQYLDGSTREAARRKAVIDFQAGAGDVFLISLKAGGFGLNLTAADYVIHLDPWWNPAVEAQASDRAHRIGQQRPVTIYRLVNSASIEERVLALHEKKRNLAEDVLSDATEATRLDPEALMALLE